ncbi:MAG: LacI family DNA-binding transcriptional regulator [Bryobacteraceae bacterium]
MVTINDVARKSGYSKTTVSFVLNDAPLAKHIPEDTKARVRRAADNLGYHPNQFARYLRSKRSNMIGVVVFDISDPYCAQILRGVEGALYRSQSYLPTLTDVQNDPARFERFVRLLLERQVEGLIVLGNSVHPEDELLKVLRECRIPVVIIGRELEEGILSSVTGDNSRGAREVLEHLYSLGHRKIAYIRGPSVMIDSSQRWKGIQEYAKEVRLQLDESLIVDSPLKNAGQQAGYEMTKRLLRRRKEFTALLAYDDVTAFGAIRALNEAGIDVPRSCSVTGFDDVTMSAYYSPPLTTVHQDMELQGLMGVQLLLEALPEPKDGRKRTPVHRRVTPRLEVRASTAPPPEPRK